MSGAGKTDAEKNESRQDQIDANEERQDGLA